MNTFVAKNTLSLFNSFVFKDSNYKNRITYMNHSEISSRIKFIGQIQKGEKINIKTMTLQPPGILTSLNRTLFNQDNRNNTKKFLEVTIANSIEIINNFINSQDNTNKQFAQNMLFDLNSCIEGLENLKETYNTDIKMCCDLDTLIEKIKLELAKYEEQFKTSKILIKDDTSSNENDENDDV